MLEEGRKPKGMVMETYIDLVKIDKFCKVGMMYVLTVSMSFIYPFLGKLFLYRSYEIILETTISCFDIVGLEVHFVRYIYFGMIDDSHEIVSNYDVFLLFVVIIPMLVFLLEFLTIPSHIKETEYAGNTAIYFSPSLILVFFLRDSEGILFLAILELLFMFFILWYITEQEDKRSDNRMKKTKGRSWAKYKDDMDKEVSNKLMQGVSNPLVTMDPSIKSQ